MFAGLGRHARADVGGRRAADAAAAAAAAAVDACSKPHTHTHTQMQARCERLVTVLFGLPFMRVVCACV